MRRKATGGDPPGADGTLPPGGVRVGNGRGSAHSGEDAFEQSLRMVVETTRQLGVVLRSPDAAAQTRYHERLNELVRALGDVDRARQGLLADPAMQVPLHVLQLLDEGVHPAAHAAQLAAISADLDSTLADKHRALRYAEERLESAAKRLRTLDSQTTT
jgi:hypothetical protein